MKLETPTRAWPLWLCGVLLAVCVFPLLIYSGQLYYAEGGQSPDAPGMLFISAVFTFPGWGSAWLLLAAPFLVRYPGAAPLLAWRGGSVLSIVLAVLAVALSAGFVWLALARVDFWKLSRLPFVMHLLACALYWQYLRAAAVHRSLVSGA